MRKALSNSIKGTELSTGVYLFVDPQDKILYVGKAKNIRKRLESHLRSTEPRKLEMLKQASGVKTIKTSTEREALLLEKQLIGLYKPPFNIMLRENKQYGQLHLSYENIPQLSIYRGKENQKKGRIFGPYPQTNMHALLQVLSEEFKIRSCNTTVYRQAERSKQACLLYDTNLCTGPCIGAVSEQEHASQVQNLTTYLEKPERQLEEKIEQEMKQAAEREEYEKAGLLRDKLKVLEKIAEHQQLVGTKQSNGVGLWLERNRNHVVLSGVEVQGGILEKVWTYRGPNEEHITDIELVHTAQAQDIELQKRIAKVTVSNIENIGKERSSQTQKQILELARKLAQTTDVQSFSSTPKEASINAVYELCGLLGVMFEDTVFEDTAVVRSECIDISHDGGGNTTGGLVYFENGVNITRNNRHFRLGNMNSDDYASIQKVVERRFGKSRAGLEKTPHLLLIDGGKGQVRSAAHILEKTSLESTHSTPILQHMLLGGLAKEEETVYLYVPSHLREKNTADLIQVSWEKDDPKTLFMRNMRDRSHSYANQKRRETLQKHIQQSGLGNIEGIGPVKEKELLRHFGSLDRVVDANISDLLKVQRIGRRDAENIYTHFREKQFEEKQFEEKREEQGQ